MYRMLIMSFSALLFVPTNPEDNINFTPIEEAFPMHWKAEMGNVTFRSNYIMNANEIIIGSNGKYYMDYSLRDEKSGVYIINRKNGKVIKHFGNEIIGDMDVTGMVRYKDRFYYGNDNEEFVCASIDGKEIWVKPTSGDIEHQPMLIYHQNNPMIIYATESGEVRAVSPENGNTIWQYFTPDFTGWKPGDNRAAFKIKSYFSNTSSFYTKPARADINNDGTDDLVYATRTGVLYAINGATGKLIWRNNHVSVSAIEKNPNTKNSFICVGTYNNSQEQNATYFFSINAKGENSPHSKINNNYCSQLSVYFYGNEILINTEEYLYSFCQNKKTDSTDRKITYRRKDSWFNKEYDENRNSSGMLFSNQSFNYKHFGKCIFNLIQYDKRNNNKGFLEIISLKDKKIVDRFQLPYDSEMPPSIEDINKDGKLDLLINCRDGNLYCYDLGTQK
ncbi:MAG: PQQ-binding-like beta-propeller repeat protein [Bacteroidota bacterium]